MKRIFLFTTLVLMISCGKEPGKAAATVQENPVAPYDTAAVDSFSVGATSIDVARRIRISSLKYQDSIKKISAQIEEEKILKKAKEEKEKADKKSAEEMKKRESEKAKKEKSASQSENSASETPVQ
ncbi:hypothetical protein [Kaistella faecalis]|uniref:hypothetical protein n=1 Tax=Kaistella faecalis TaxID=2852098 RepID=UPI001C489075|nr:hypothetical protein [Chryseobacterium faecale]UFK96655.1 hypothetical protein LL667_06645 [Chryseobacterium faecale]